MREEKPGFKDFENEKEAIEFAKERVAEMWVTHYYPFNLNGKWVDDKGEFINWRVSWWCQ